MDTDAEPVHADAATHGDKSVPHADAESPITHGGMDLNFEAAQGIDCCVCSRADLRDQRSCD